MLSKIVLLLLICSANCFSLKPIKKFLESKEIEVTQSKIADCGDGESAFHMTNAVLLPDPMLFPGNVSLTATIKVLEDLPDDLKMKVTLKKTFPPINVPCVNNFGSCTYDLCKDVFANPKVNDTLCPNSGLCGCPIKAGTYEVKNLEDEEPDLPGGAFLEGDYIMECVVVDKVEEQTFGCVNIAFTIKKNNKKSFLRKNLGLIN